MPDESSNPYARLWRRSALPEEALTTVKILEEFDYELYKIAFMGGREVYAASAGREEQFDVGKEEKVLLRFYSTKFKSIPSPEESPGLGIWPVSSNDGPVRRYRYAGKIQGLYDWSVNSDYGGSSHIALNALLDVGFPFTFCFGFNPYNSDRTYFGFSDFISGEGLFEMMHADYLQDHVYFLKSPPWRRRSVDFVFIEDDADWYRPPMPSKAERKEIRKKARTLEDESVSDRPSEQTSRKRRWFEPRKRP